MKSETIKKFRAFMSRKKGYYYTALQLSEDIDCHRKSIDRLEQGKGKGKGNMVYRLQNFMTLQGFNYKEGDDV